MIPQLILGALVVGIMCAAIIASLMIIYFHFSNKRMRKQAIAEVKANPKLLKREVNDYDKLEEIKGEITKLEGEIRELGTGDDVRGRESGESGRTTGSDEKERSLPVSPSSDAGSDRKQTDNTRNNRKRIKLFKPKPLRL